MYLYNFGTQRDNGAALSKERKHCRFHVLAEDSFNYRITTLYLHIFNITRDECIYE